MRMREVGELWVSRGGTEKGREGQTDGKTVQGTSCNQSMPCHPVPLQWSVCPPASDAFFQPRASPSLGVREVGWRPERERARDQSVYGSPPERHSCSIETQQPGEVWGSLRAAAACCFFTGRRGLIIKATSHFLCDDKRLVLPLDLMVWKLCCILRKEVR